MEFVVNNFVWIVVAFVSGGLLLWPVIRSRTAGPSVSPLQATLMINREDAIVLDVREADEFARGHVPNARGIPLGQVANRLGEIDKYKDKPVIVLCQHGNRSASACSTLRKHGFNKVFNLGGGLNAWEQAGQPVTTK